MKRLLVGMLMLGAWAGCGSTASTACTKSDQCPTLRCLPDGGMAAADAGGLGIRACAFGKCVDTCD